MVALAAWPRRIGSALSAGAGERVFGHYLKIGADGRVTVAVPQAETGQGIWTALPQIVADELGADWQSVAVEPAPASPVYANPLWREIALAGDEAERITAGATSVRAFERPLREAGAVARAMLCAAAAERWAVAAAECDTADGFVMHEGKRLRFGEVAEEAASVPARGEPVLRPAGSGPLAGRPLPRLDLPPKSDGSLRFAPDVRLPEMVYAAAALVPDGGVLSGYDRSVNGVVASDRWIGALGPTSWAARQKLGSAAPRIAAPAEASTATLMRALQTAIDSGEPAQLLGRGDQVEERGRWVRALYGLAPALHLGLEPLSATARFKDGRLEVWAATQAPERTRAAAAKAAGLGTGDVLLYPMPVGAPDGRAVHADAVPLAVELARRLERPVQVILFPGQSRRSDRPRPPALIQLRARLGPDNRLLAWQSRSAGMGRGQGDFPYAVPSVRIEKVAAELPLPESYMRGGAAVTDAFARECFIDELARQGGFEPLSFRIGMLGGQPRLAAVLSAAATLGGWDGGGAGSSLGLACLSAYGSHIALLASAGIAADQSVRVDRLVAAVDCGRAINPGLVRQQVEGGLMAGLAQAVARPPVLQAGLIDGPGAAAPRLSGTPEILVELVPSTGQAGGVSGLGDAVLAPAVANAVAAATGRRLRSLPFDPMSAE